MFHAVETSPTKKENYVRPAIVIDSFENGKCRIRLEDEHGGHEIWARSALVHPYTPRVRDRVLVAGEGFEACYVIGVLERQEEDATNRRTLVAQDGASASLVEGQDSESLQIRDPRGQLLFEYQPTTGKSVLSVPAGDLEIHSPHGNIDLIAGKAVRFQGNGAVTLQSRTAIDLAAQQEGGEQGGSIALRPGSAELSGQRIGMTAERGDFLIGRGYYQGKQFSATVEGAKLILGKLETVVSRLLERAKNVYRHVENLHQLKARRVRTLVSGSYHLKGQRTYIKAEKAVKINGDQIHLG